MKNSKSSKGILVVTIILALALIGSGSYITYTEFFAKKEGSKTEEKKETTEVAISAEEKTKLLERIADINNYNLGMYDDLDISKVSNQEKLAFVSFIVANKKLNGEKPSIVGLSGKKVTEIYQSYFGSSSTIINEDIKMGNTSDSEVLFKYNKEKDIYEIGKEAWESLYYVPMSYNITAPNTFYVEGTKNNNLYTIKVNSLFETPISGDISSPAKVIAGSYTDAKNMKKIEGTDSWYDSDGNLMKEEITNTDYEQVKDKIPTHTYTFALENGNYILQSKTMSK